MVSGLKTDRVCTISEILLYKDVFWDIVIGKEIRKWRIRKMKYVTVPEFVENIEEIIDNALLNEEMANIETEDGEHLILMTEHQYDCFVEAMANKAPR